MKAGQSQVTEDALFHFNTIKDLYSQKIDELNELKKMIFSQSDQQLDQQLRAKLRITIESLLIDLNEEVFGISEELAKSFTFQRNKHMLAQRANEFEQRQQQLFKKIKDTVENNPTIKTLRRNKRIKEQSPPQRDLNTFGATGSEEFEQRQNQQKPVPHPKHIHTMREPSPQQKSRKIKIGQSSSQKNLQEGGYQSEGRQRQGSIHLTQPQYNTQNIQIPIQHQRQQKLPKKQKSPIPLRRKDQQQTQQQITSSFNEDPVIQMLRTSNSSQRFNNSAKRQLQFQSDKELRRVFGYTSDGVKKNESKKHIKKLDEFERYLSNKQTGKQASGRKASSTRNKENFKPNQTFDEQEKFHINQTTLELQSEAFQVFAQDFAHMKSKMIQMQRQINNNEEKTQSLEELCNKLKTDNVKLVTDMRLIGKEQTELIQRVHYLERKNAQLQQENQIFRNILSNERTVKGQETNMPRQGGHYRDESASNISIHSGGGHDLRKQSPFSSFLNRHRSMSNNQINPQPELNSGGASLRNLRFANDISNQDIRNKEFNKNEQVLPQHTLNQTSTSKLLNQSFERENHHNQTLQNTRQPLNEPPNSIHNTLMSGRDDQQQQQYNSQNNFPNNNSFLRLQPQINNSRQISGPQTMKGDGLAQHPSFSYQMRNQMTPTTPERLLNVTNQPVDDTPSRANDQSRKELTGYNSLNMTQNSLNRNENSLVIERNRSFAPLARLNQNSQSSKKLLGLNETTGTQNREPLSDWVLERMKK
ncbi:UNKNOWN [Stylonychia lemnae]|uniref:Uncharacterized protein n=1 Tax=Stylonychia lemnae TaxID=5949 RepID=A0A078AL88_STYLE|nr:UNKNOWN [Stylonychia lemnae]|eukprot:CDW81628.1 UNKNOWN [Stylonychia lemnae]